MRQRVRDIVKVGDKLFSDRFPILTLWQTQAENFHVMRADFTRTRYMSEEFGSYLMSGRPARCHRDLSDAFSAMLRRDQWFHAATDNELVNEDREAKIWLDTASKQMRRHMYDRRANFVRSTKVADKDFCAFGNAVITRDVVDFQHLLYQPWHLRDVCWAENYSGFINLVNFNWNPEARQAVERFKNTKTGEISSKLLELANGKDGQAFTKVKCRRIILEADQYDLDPKKVRGMKWVSVYVDTENETILEEIALPTFPATIPRWEFGGSMYGNQYGYSPPVVYGTPDGRMMQQIMLSLLEASEKATNPPMIAVGEAINGAVNLYAAGITQTDADYDERTGDVLRPISMQLEGIRFGAEQLEQLHGDLKDSFYLSKIQFPEISKEMTAFEASKLWDEYIRQSLPLWEPVQAEYNGAMCDGTFEDLLRHGTFGAVEDMPQILRGRDITWTFDTPITVAAEKALTASYQTMLQMITEGGQVDPNVMMIADIPSAAREASDGAGVPTKWLVPDDEFKRRVAQKQQQAAAVEQANMVAHGADVATRVATAAESAGNAATSLQQSGLM
jgi:hypothetical protein